MMVMYRYPPLMLRRNKKQGRSTQVLIFFFFFLNQIVLQPAFTLHQVHFYDARCQAGLIRGQPEKKKKHERFLLFCANCLTRATTCTRRCSVKRTRPIKKSQSRHISLYSIVRLPFSPPLCILESVPEDSAATALITPMQYGAHGWLKAQK